MYHYAVPVLSIDAYVSDICKICSSLVAMYRIRYVLIGQAIDIIITYSSHSIITSSTLYKGNVVNLVKHRFTIAPLISAQEIKFRAVSWK